MVTPQLLDYVRQQLAAGVAQDDIRHTLATQGWAEQDIGEAFAPAPPPQTFVSSVKPTKTRWPLIVVAVLGLIAVVGGAYLYMQTKHLIPPLGPSGPEATPTLPESATSTVSATGAVFGNPQPVTIQGYEGFADEPFISRDGQYLFWNNPNGGTFYAKKITDTTFKYVGKVQGFSTANVYNGVPSMDEAGNFYFVSATGSGKGTYRLYRGTFKDGTVTNISVLGITGNQNGQDMEISADGQTLYYMVPQGTSGEDANKSTLVMAAKNADGSFTKLAGSDDVLKNITVEGNAEYAPDISADGLELYYTAAIAGQGSGIYVSTRASTSEPFGAPQLILKVDETTGLREAPSISPDGTHLYYGQQKVIPGVQMFLMQLYVLTRQ